MKILNEKADFSKGVVTTLPITPQPDPSFGLFITPLVGSLWAQILARPFVLCLNIKGKKSQGLNSDEDIASFNYLTLLSRLGISIDALWTDGDIEHQKFLKYSVDKLQSQDNIWSSEKSISRCECGIVEMLTEAIPSYSREAKIFKIVNEIPVCKLCGSVLQEHKTKVLCFKASHDIKRYQVIPSSFKQAIEHQFREDSQKDLLISRIRKTELAANLFSENFWLDVDFGWGGLFASLHQQGILVNHCVISSHSIRPAVYVALVSQTISKVTEAVNLLITPYIRIKRSPHTEEWQNLGMENLLTRYGKTIVRFFVLLGLQWGRQEVQVGSENLFWLNRSGEFLSRLVQSSRNSLPERTEDFLSKVNTIAIKNYLSEIRKGNNAEFLNIISFIGDLKFSI